jgi:DNA polymerase-3 subunit delta
MAKRSPQRGSTPRFQDLLQQDLRAGHIRPVYVLCGDDQLRIEQVVDAIKAQTLDAASAAFNDHVLDAEQDGWGGILQRARGFPMFGQRQVVWARHADRIKGAGQENGESALIEYIRHPVESSVLVITGEKFLGTKSWVKAARQAGYFYELNSPVGIELERWIMRSAAKAGLTLTGSGAQILAELVGNDLQALRSEIDKLALLQEINERVFAPDEIPQLVMDQAQKEVFGLTDAMGPGRNTQVLRHWFSMTAWGSAVEELSPIVLTHLRRAALIAACLAHHRDARDIAEFCGLNPWLVTQKLLPLARQHPPAVWRRVLAACLECESAIKRRPLPGALAFERLLFDICCST